MGNLGRSYSWAHDRYEWAVAQARSRSQLVDHVWRAMERFNEVFAGRLAAAISYYGFFAALSLTVLAYAVVGQLLGSASDRVEAGVDEYMSTTLPWVVPTARQSGGGQLTVIGLSLLMFSGVGWVESLRTAQRAVWRLEQAPGHWLPRQLVDLVMLLGLGLLWGLSVATMAVAYGVLRRLASDTALDNLLAQVAGPVLALVVNMVLAAAILGVVPRLRLRSRRLLPAIAIMAVGLELLNTVGMWFIVRTEARQVYQLVAGTVGLLIYLYLLNQLVLFAAAFAATSPHGTVRDLARGVDLEEPVPDVEPGGGTGPSARSRPGVASEHGRTAPGMPGM